MGEVGKYPMFEFEYIIKSVLGYLSHLDAINRPILAAAINEYKFFQKIGHGIKEWSIY